jgi:hypothetical protein
MSHKTMLICSISLAQSQRHSKKYLLLTIISLPLSPFHIWILRKMMKEDSKLPTDLHLPALIQKVPFASVPVQKQDAKKIIVNASS